MKIAVITGSPNGMKGNTGRLLEEVLAGLEVATEVEMLDLSILKVNPCTGCDVCHKTGVCCLKDDYELIKTKLLESDGFIIGSPNYIFSVSAQMKALFDRSCNIIHCLALEGKYGAVVETSGSGEDEEVIRYMVRFINATGAQSVGGIGSNTLGKRTFPKEKILFENARRLGQELCRCIREEDHFPDQAGFRGGFKARMKRLVEQRKEDWPSEYRYWQEHHSVVLP